MARFALLRKDKQQAGTAPSVSDLEAVLSELATESAEATAAIEKLEARRTEVLLHENDEAAKKHDEHTADLRRRLDRANARIEALRVEIEERKAEEAQRAKREERAEIEKKVEAARKVLAGYEAHAKAIVEIIRMIAESDDAIETFQRKHPDDERIVGAERVRSQDAQPERIVSRKVIEVWCWANNPTCPVPENLLKSLRGSGREGMVDVVSDSGTRAVHVVKVDFEECRVVHAVPAKRADKLASAIALPAFKGGDWPLWDPVDSPYASSVLAKLERRASARAAERTPEVVLRALQRGQS